MMVGKQAFLIDLAERVAATVGLSGAAALTVTNLSFVQSASLAGAAGVGSAVKGVLASFVGDRGTAALLPAGDVPPAGDG